MTILGREPAQWLGLLTTLVSLLSVTFFDFTTEQQGTINAVLAALIGIVTAMAVSAEKAMPLVAGLVQAVLALMLSFGMSLAPETIGGIMAFVAAAVAMFVRTQVVAPVPATDAP